MPTLQTYILMEGIDEISLMDKISLYYPIGEPIDNFKAMMVEVISDTLMSEEKLMKLLTKYNIDYRRLIDFILDNVDGQVPIDYDYTMKKVVDLLKNNKSLSWE